MFWFKKKKEDDLPEPPAPEAPEVPKMPEAPEPIELPPTMPEMPEIKEPERMEVHKPKPNEPIFILKQRYQGMLEEIDKIKSDSRKANKISQDVLEIDKGTMNSFEDLRMGLEDLERKINYVDKLLFGE